MSLRRSAIFLLCLGLLSPVWSPSAPHAVAQSGQTLAEDWRQTTAADFAPGTLDDVQVVDVGDGAVILASVDGEQATRGLYTSPIRRSALVFNAVGIQWQAETPPGTAVSVYLRVSGDGSTWSQWQEVMDPEEEGPRFFAPAPMIVEAAGYVQYRLELSTEQPQSTPQVEEVMVTCIDSRLGPSLGDVEHLQLAAVPQPGAVPQPPIISRAQWGANEAYRFDASGHEIWPTEYRLPQKIIIHHSVTPNNEPNPPATVRAIYYYHAVTKGWGDVGYNYLVDWKGNIYEGRYGGPEVVGGHA